MKQEIKTECQPKISGHGNLARPLTLLQKRRPLNRRPDSEAGVRVRVGRGRHRIHSGFVSFRIQRISNVGTTPTLRHRRVPALLRDGIVRSDHVPDERNPEIRM